MVKFKYIWVIPAFLAPLVATKSNAQVFIDLVGIMREAHCREHYEELKNESVCQEFYRGWNPTQGQRTNPNIRSLSIPPQTPPTSTSSSNSRPISPKFIKALQDCNNSFIRGYIDGSKAYNLPIPPQMLQRAQQCGAI